MLPSHVVCLSTVRNKHIRRHLVRRKTRIQTNSIVLHLDGPLLGVNVLRDRTSLTCRRGRLHGAHLDVRRRRLQLGRSHVNLDGRLIRGRHHFERCRHLCGGGLLTHRSCLRTRRSCRTTLKRLTIISRQVGRSSLFHDDRLRDLSRGVQGVGGDLTLIHKQLRGLGIGTPISKRLKGLRTRVNRSVTRNRHVNRIVAPRLGIRTGVSRRCIRHIVPNLPTDFRHRKGGCSVRIAGICPRIQRKRFHASLRFISNQPRGVHTKRACRLGLRLNSPIPTIVIPHNDFCRTDNNRCVCIMSRRKGATHHHPIHVNHRGPRCCRIIRKLRPKRGIVVSKCSLFNRGRQLVLH